MTRSKTNEVFYLLTRDAKGSLLPQSLPYCRCSSKGLFENIKRKVRAGKMVHQSCLLRPCCPITVWWWPQQKSGSSIFHGHPCHGLDMIKVNAVDRIGLDWVSSPTSWAAGAVDDSITFHVKDKHSRRTRHWILANSTSQPAGNTVSIQKLRKARSLFASFTDGRDTASPQDRHSSLGSRLELLWPNIVTIFSIIHRVISRICHFVEAYEPGLRGIWTALEILIP